MTTRAPRPEQQGAGRQRWAVLAVVSAAQFLIILDLWVVNNARGRPAIGGTARYSAHLGVGRVYQTGPAGVRAGERPRSRGSHDDDHDR
jgi:hypothetical protein